MLRTQKYFELIIKQSLNSAFIRDMNNNIMQISEAIIHLGALASVDNAVLNYLISYSASFNNSVE